MMQAYILQCIILAIFIYSHVVFTIYFIILFCSYQDVYANSAMHLAVPTQPMSLSRCPSSSISSLDSISNSGGVAYGGGVSVGGANGGGVSVGGASGVGSGSGVSKSRGLPGWMPQQDRQPEKETGRSKAKT